MYSFYLEYLVFYSITVIGYFRESIFLFFDNNNMQKMSVSFLLENSATKINEGHTRTQTNMHIPQKKDLFRRQGEGRHVGLGDRILAALAVLPRSFLNKRMSSTICFKKTQTKQLAWQGFCPPIRCDDLRLVF